MRCLGVIPGTRRVDVVSRPEPGLPGEGEILMEVLECGVCATDRHIISGGWGRPEPGQTALVLGHEPLGRVLAVGAGVSHLAEGDLVSATNQRSCGGCAPCLGGEPDLCMTGAGSGRGVGGQDGFLQPRTLELGQYAVRVPADLRAVGVLTEPMAVAQKAIEQLRQIQRRLPGSRWVEASDDRWAEGLRMLVGGAGPIGTLVALALAVHGAEVHVLDRAPSSGAKARWLSGIGATYHLAGDLDPKALRAELGPIDAAFEASGSAAVCVTLWRALGPNGALAMIGGAGGPHDPIHPGELLGQALGRNQVLFGIVASNPRHFRLATADLAAAQARFPESVAGLISARCDFDHADQAFAPGDDDDIKRVITLAAG